MTDENKLELLRDDVRGAVRALLEYSSVEAFIIHAGPEDNSPYIVVGDNLALRRICDLFSSHASDESSFPVH